MKNEPLFSIVVNPKENHREQVMRFAAQLITIFFQQLFYIESGI